MARILILLYDYFRKNRTVFFIVLLLSFCIPAFFALKIKFEEDISKILPKDKKIEKLNEVFQNSKFLDKLVITVSLKDTTAAAQPDSLVTFTDTLISRLQEKLPSYVRKVSGRADDNLAMDLLGTVTGHLPVYLDENDYNKIDSLITPAQLRQTLAQNFKTLTSPAGMALKEMISNDPVGISSLGLKKLQQLQYDENFELYDSYVVTKDQKHLLLFVTPAFLPANTGKNAFLLEGLDNIIKELGDNQFNTVTASYFGSTAVSVGNALQLRRDTLLTQGVTVLFLIVFLGIYFRKKSASLLIMIPVIFGVLFSLAIIYFIKGSISVIALGTGSVVLGIAVSYSLHVFNHYRHTRDIYRVIRDLAIPMTVGSFTTIGGFLCLQFVKSEMLKDLGLFAAFSLVGASLSSLIFLPQFLGSKKEGGAGRTIATSSFLDRLAAYKPEYNKYLVAFIFAGTVFFARWAKEVSFESDLGKMNFMSAKLKKAETDFNAINRYALQSVYIVTEGKTLQEALMNNEKLATDIQYLRQKNIVQKYSGVSVLLVSDSLQKARITRWKNYWSADKKAALFRSLTEEGAALNFSPTAFDRFSELLNKDFEPTDPAAMNIVRQNFLDDYITEKPGKTSVVTLLKAAPEHKQEIYKAFENRQNVIVLDKQYLAGRFVEIIKADFTSIAVMTSLLVFVVLLIMYGRIELTFISFIPMFISWIWILGIMGFTGMHFNIINIIVSALIFGLGDDYSLYIMDGLLQEYKTGKKNLSSYKSSILLSAITTIAGLGVLIFAQHPALRSIAAISITGILSVVIMSQILIPFLFNLLIRNRVRKGLFPWTLTGFLKSAFAFSLFISVSIFFSVLGRILALLKPNEKRKYLYHLLISKACKLLMYVMVNVKKKIINPLNEDFSKPAIIICNHQSSLDIVPLLMLHPKILMLTNNKKWNAHFFGPVIRMADYFPAEDVEHQLDRIRDRIRHGYSLVIFPEGTRSEDGVVKRFHKGAFYLAEQLNVDLLPIIIHGTEYTLTKKDALVKDGHVTLKFLPRIAPGNLQFGSGYAERAKNIGRYFRGEFNNLKTETEQTAYFRGKLIANYIYKGPVIEWYTKIKTRLEKNYSTFHELVPMQGKILDIGCGNGFLTYLLSFTSGKREITGLDYDEEKIKIANNCFSKTGAVRFLHTDVLAFEFEQYDAIILADILHYLTPKNQTQIIEKCIAQLNPGGIIIIMEGNKDEVLKHKRTELTEFFSTRLLKFNKTGDQGLSFLSAVFLSEIASKHLMDYREIRDSKVTSNTIFALKKKVLDKV